MRWIDGVYNKTEQSQQIMKEKVMIKESGARLLGVERKYLEHDMT